MASYRLPRFEVKLTHPHQFSQNKGATRLVRASCSCSHADHRIMQPCGSRSSAQACSACCQLHILRRGSAEGQRRSSFGADMLRPVRGGVAWDKIVLDGLGSGDQCGVRKRSYPPRLPQPRSPPSRCHRWRGDRTALEPSSETPSQDGRSVGKFQRGGFRIRFSKVVVRCLLDHVGKVFNNVLLGVGMSRSVCTNR